MSIPTHGDTVRIEPWGTGDLHVLEMTVGDPEMTTHLGGPETAEKMAERQASFENLNDPSGRMFTIVEVTSNQKIGSVGYWDRSWHGEEIYEMGWFVIVGFQGRGFATMATAQAIESARAQGRHRSAHAFPSVENPASNAICRRLGFELVEACEFEYPPGSFMRCNDWRLDL